MARSTYHRNLVGKSRLFRVGIVIVLLNGSLAGCASVTSDDRATALSASTVIGGILGAVHCLATDSEDCAEDIVIAAALGAVAGEVAYRIRESYAERDKEIEEISKKTGIKTDTETHVILETEKEKEFEKKIEQTPKAQQVEVAREQAAYRTAVSDVFAAGSATPSPVAEMALRSIADAYLKSGMRDVLTVGHADNAETATNQNLSEQRAQAVAQIFIEQGYSQDKIYYQGAGTSEPIADNATATGRAKNRRVEIVDANNPAALARVKRIFIQESQSHHQESVAATPPPQPQPSAEPVKVPNTTDSVVDFGGVAATPPPQPSAEPVKAPNITDSVIDFGGEPLAQNAVSKLLQYAKVDDSSSAFFISEARASTLHRVPDFVGDDLLVSGAIKRSDNSNKELYNFSDYMSGYKNAVLYAHFNQQVFSVYPVSLLRERTVATPQIAPAVHQKIKGTIKES
ncbi:OmpA family protein [Candidatus Spongiihabitans sp.]|uniref:OmpA family protein n=1 Tax=Candidatus Spongiihabitans sp. TaxID=3101308 RepID=UPI003C7BD46E